MKTLIFSFTHDPRVLIALFSILGVLLVLDLCGIPRARRTIQRWAETHKLRLIRRECRRLRRGPFVWNSNQRQLVFRITVEDADGRVFDGWARCGTKLPGPFSDRVDIVWDPPPSGFAVILPPAAEESERL